MLLLVFARLVGLFDGTSRQLAAPLRVRPVAPVVSGA
jgi:hypothetical protein